MYKYSKHIAISYGCPNVTDLVCKHRGTVWNSDRKISLRLPQPYGKSSDDYLNQRRFSSGTVKMFTNPSN
jgi:hypothetical protein